MAGAGLRVDPGFALEKEAENRGTSALGAVAWRAIHSITLARHAARNCHHDMMNMAWWHICAGAKVRRC
jgi:hypothetical protein